MSSRFEEPTEKFVRSGLYLRTGPLAPRTPTASGRSMVRHQRFEPVPSSSFKVFAILLAH